MARSTRRTEEPIRGIFEKPVGSGIWWIRYTDGAGQYKREKVGRHSDAVSLYQKRKTDARMGIKMLDNIRNKGVTFQALADAILVHVEQHGYKDQRNVKSRLEKLCKEFGPMEAEKILPEHITDWLSQNTKTPATSNRYKATISLVFREGLRNRRVTTNPARMVRGRRESNERIRYLLPEEDERLMAVMQRHYPERLPELVISLGTGMRLSEQYGLTWADVDLRHGLIHIRESKNGTPREIPMSGPVKEAFTELSKGTSKGGRVFAMGSPRGFWHDALDKAKIDGYVWHCNRHTFCTRLTEKGVQLKVIQKLAGHKTIAMTARYAKATDDTLRQAVALL
jgi:site-specific recombinase XerD